MHSKNKSYNNWKVDNTNLDGVFKITPSVFEDFRGKYVEIYNKEFMQKNNIDINFLQDDISVSKKNVIRGIHGNNDTWKLISCLYGNFQLIVVNNDANSPQYKKWVSFDLSSDNREQILVPPKFGNGHLVKSDFAIFHYKQNTQYIRESQFTIKWNDPQYDFVWEIKVEPILSERDK